MSQPDPGPTQAPSWPQPSLGNKRSSRARIRDAAATETKPCHSAFCSCPPFPLRTPPEFALRVQIWLRVQAAAPQQLLASVAETLPPSPSPTWRQSKLQHCSELVLSSLRSQPVPRDTFLWLPEASREEKPSWAPPHPSQAVYRQRSDHLFFCCLFPSLTLSLVARLRKKKTHLLLKCVFIGEAVEWERAEFIFLTF